MNLTVLALRRTCERERGNWERNEVLYLSDTLNGAFQLEPEVNQQIQSAMPPETMAACQRMFQAAESLRAQAAHQQTSTQQSL